MLRHALAQGASLWDIAIIQLPITGTVGLLSITDL